jgi:hypothetical protein
LKLALSFFFVVLLFVLIYPVGSYGQAASTSGRLEGVVLDASGTGVPGATVVITNKKTDVSRTLKTDEEGHFVALYLPPGIYEVSIEKEGFQKQVLRDTAVTVGTTTALHPRLTVGKVETSVIVSASAVAVDPTQSSLGTVVDNRSIQSLPLNGRNFTDFALLTPGATTDGDFGMISFNGIAGNFNNYTVDGGNNNNAFFAQQIGRTSIPFQFSEDVIQEFQVTSTGYEAEFGQAAGWSTPSRKAAVTWCTVTPTTTSSTRPSTQTIPSTTPMELPSRQTAANSLEERLEVRSRRTGYFIWPTMKDRSATSR